MWRASLGFKWTFSTHKQTRFWSLADQKRSSQSRHSCTTLSTDTHRHLWNLMPAVEGVEPLWDHFQFKKEQSCCVTTLRPLPYILQVPHRQIKHKTCLLECVKVMFLHIVWRGCIKMSFKFYWSSNFALWLDIPGAYEFRLEINHWQSSSFRNPRRVTCSSHYKSHWPNWYWSRKWPKQNSKLFLINRQVSRAKA